MLKTTLLSAALLIGLSTLARAQIVVGLAGPMTGPNASFGAQMRAGAEQAVRDINADGGVLGHKIELAIGDDACDPRQAVSVANDLVRQGAKVVIGHYCSSSSIPASKVYAEEGVLEITPASTSPAYTDAGGWNTFRTCGRDDQQGRVAGLYIASHFADRPVAILNDNSAYGRGLAEETEKYMKQAGKMPALVSAYVPGEKDYFALINRMKAANIGVIYVGGYQTEAGLIARQARDQGLQAVLLGGDALVTNEYWQITGGAGSGTMMTFPADPRILPSAAAVMREFESRHIDPEGYVLYTYAALQVWRQAAARAGTVAPHPVAAALKADGPFATVVGPIAYDSKGDLKDSNYVLYRWSNGAYHQM